MGTQFYQGGRIILLPDNQKLRGASNYHVWAEQMKHVLFVAGCLDHVLPQPGHARKARVGTQAEKHEWDDNDIRGIQAIQENIIDSQHFYSDEEQESVANLWDFFATEYEDEPVEDDWLLSPQFIACLRKHYNFPG
eukprot:TRINITY_DN33484_c0_g1_i1.p1 TRINITY_DN33484_c0_g1~~TRINITY_DN33484_c0_g1_i1.p1  ORF type:complete len:136 (-),score=3.94 TRINITY_DN33484_c0_g1_i1:455-862(-)